MIIRPIRVFPRLAFAAALVAACGLGGCGRKGPLDAPPGAQIEPTPAANAAALKPSQTEEERTLFGDTSRPSPSTAPVAPKGQKKHIPLDVLLD